MNSSAASPRPRARRAAALVFLLAAACEQSDSPESFAPLVPSDALTPDVLELLATTPAADAERVATDTELTVSFDAPVLLESLQAHAPTPLTIEATGATASGLWKLSAGGDVATFRLDAELATDTAYVLQLSPLVTAVDGRLLEFSHPVPFRTADTRAPVWVTATPSNGQTTDRQGRAVLTFDETLSSSPAPTLELVEVVSGRRHPTTFELHDDTLRVRSLVDLPGDVAVRWEVEGLVDAGGNPVAPRPELTLYTSPDYSPPRLVQMWPDEGQTVAPGAPLRLTFDESIDLSALRPDTFTLQGPGGPILTDVTAGPELRTLWVQPRATLQEEALFSVVFGPGIRDLTGNELALDAAITFVVGDDSVGPRVVASTPTDGAENVSPQQRDFEVRFDENLDPVCLDGAVLQQVGEPAWPAVRALHGGGTTLRFFPEEELVADALYEITLPGADRASTPACLRDLDGNPLETTQTIRFRVATLADDLLALRIYPTSGALRVPTNAAFSILADRPLDRASCTTDTIALQDADGVPVPAELRFDEDPRRVRVVPQRVLQPNSRYALKLLGEASGILGADGTELAWTRIEWFRTGFVQDVTPPAVQLTIDGIGEERLPGLGTAPFGFSLDITTTDQAPDTIDWSSLELRLDGAAEGPNPLDLRPYLDVQEAHRASLRLPSDHDLPIGGWTVTARVADIAGNEGQSASLQFDVVQSTAERQPFERTQVVWIRTDMDRDGDGRIDFQQDLLRIGLRTAGDPVGANAGLERMVARGIARRANELYERQADGSRRTDGSSTPVLFTTEQPVGATTVMEMACGGLDPESTPGRTTGDASSGVLGRAWFDLRNGDFLEDAVDTNPGLGVFPSELYLFEAKLHLDLFPSFLTSFGRRFQPLSPDLGGTPAGAHPLDVTVLSPTFDPSTATVAARARYEAIMQAADDWARAIGTIVAHEAGHAVGLVAQGDDGSGLHGDASLHNRRAGITDVMAATLGYDAMVSLDYEFRDLNLAYLRQRVLLK